MYPQVVKSGTTGPETVDSLGLNEPLAEPMDANSLSSKPLVASTKASVSQREPTRDPQDLGLPPIRKTTDLQDLAIPPSGNLSPPFPLPPIGHSSPPLPLLHPCEPSSPTPLVPAPDDDMVNEHPNETRCAVVPTGSEPIEMS